MCKIFAIGIVFGIVITALLGPRVYRFAEKHDLGRYAENLPSPVTLLPSIYSHKLTMKFDQSLELKAGQSFGPDNFLTAELFRGGKITADGKSGYARQISGSYRDSAIIRSTKKLPARYKISVVVGGIDYGLEKIAGLEQDPEYTEGPQNENGVYLLAITDVEPRGHHNNLWWHQHRKVVIDVDNNVWGHGMPHPMFMVYFDRNNELKSFDGRSWTTEWRKAVTYDPKAWYRIEIEKTWAKYILTISAENGRRLARASVPLKKVLHTASSYPDYFALGDPHENYYTGNFRVKEIELIY